MIAQSIPRLEIDFKARDFAKNPLPTYQLLLAEFPVCQLSDDTYVVSRYEDVKFILKRHDLFGSGWTEPLFASPDWLPEKYKRDYFLSEVDPPEHTQHSAILNKSFISSAIENLAPYITETSFSLIEHIKRNSGSEVDFLTIFAYPLAIKAVTKVIGLQPDVDIERIRNWITLMETIPSEHPGLAQQAEIETMFLDQTNFYDEIISDRQQHPKNDLISTIANSTIDDCTLTNKKIRSALNLLLLAGIEAPAQTLARAIILLSQREDIVKLLQADPDKISPFIEELIRLGTSSQGSFRTSKVEIHLHGLRIPAGARILALIGAANRDPSQFQDPDTFQMERPNIKSHMGFGKGVHVCIGAALARMEIRIGLQALLDTFQHFECPSIKELNWYNLVIAHLLRALPVQFR